jgi:hypothetical protein
MRINVFGGYTYTLETIIQAGLSDLVVKSVSVRTNPDLRPSRLVRSIGSYVRRSLGTILRVLLIYRPLVMFFSMGAIAIFVGLVVGARFLWYFLNGEGSGHIQSVVLSGLCLTLGAMMMMMGLIADLIAVNRKLSERILLRIKRIERAVELIGRDR